MLLSLLHEIASYPWVYDRIQRLAGVRQVHARMSRQLPGEGTGYVVDVGEAEHRRDVRATFW